MDLYKKSFTELKALFEVVFKDWEENILQIKRVQKKECERYSEFVASRAELRRLAKSNAILHNRLVQIDLELQIRTWTGLND